MGKTKLLVAVLVVGLAGLYALKISQQNGGFAVLSKKKPAYQPETYNLVKRNGRIKTYYPNRKVKSDKVYREGVLDGPYKTYYENGKVKEEGQYKNGVLISSKQHPEK